ncbi:tetratricopeptide repeat protein [Nonomuraea cavernae]|uniref:tetratricopeptide repeat protein n=1 Tax=Nonomuraea cavernae TaxID=2045107 RepID=UPI0033FD7624
MRELNDNETFAALLKHHRLRRRLTQEALAELAEISARSIGDIERGRGRTPRSHTVDRLALALNLTNSEREEFVQVARALSWAGRAGASDRISPSTRMTQPGRDEHSGDDRPAGRHDVGRQPLRNLPADLPDFVGRDCEIAKMCAVLGTESQGGRLVAVSGPPGAGKTALAVHAAHRLAPLFPDGQLFARLGDGSREPAGAGEVLDKLLRALGLDGAALPAAVDERAGLLRARLAERRILLVIDDATGHGDVEPLLPAAGCAMVVTSRVPLTGLPGVTAVDLSPLPTEAAVDLLGRVAGDRRVQAEPDAAEELVSMCGGLPLAVRIAAARLAARPTWMVATLTAKLADERVRLDELRHGDLAVRPGLHLAFQELSPNAARAFALLGELNVHSFPEWAVAMLLDTPSVAGGGALEELLDARLADAVGPDPAGQPRYRFHDLTKLYARECRRARIGESDWRAALARAAGGWLALARHAQDRLRCERFHLDDRSHPAFLDDANAFAVAAGHPIEWFEAERETLGALVRACAEAGLTGTAWSLAACAADFYELRAYYDDWHRATEIALEACRRGGDRAGEAAMLRSLGSCLVELDEQEAAVSTLRAARELAEELADPAGAAMARKDLGFVLSLSGRLDEAQAALRGAAEELGDVGRHATRAIALTSLGFVLRQRGDTAQAVEVIQTALAGARACGDRFAQAYALRGLSGALSADGRTAQAAEAARRAAALFTRVGDPIGVAQSLRALGEALAHEDHRSGEAEEALTAAAAVFQESGHSWGLVLTELSLGEMQARQGVPEAVGRLRQCLQFWTDKRVPALRVRTLLALASAAERAGDPAARDLLVEVFGLYREVGSPAAAELARRLGLPEDALPPGKDAGSPDVRPPRRPADARTV